MRKVNGAMLVVLIMVLGAVNLYAAPISFRFSDKDYLDGASWGEMEIGVVSDGGNTLSVRYSAAGYIPEGSLATGFGFTFDGTVSRLWNPADSAFLTDQNDLDWIVGSSSLNPPVPANGDEFTPSFDKGFVEFTVTEGNANNYNPPGILPREMDIFYLEFEEKTFLSTDDLYGFVLATGVRLQSLPNDINKGSLFLAGNSNPVPIPGSVLLLGSGLIGLVAVRRRP